MNRRLVELDWLRGLVMVLMAVDHSDAIFNPAHPAPFMDTDLWYVPGSLPGNAQFFTRWITHLCAPTFLFLVGAAIALSAGRRAASGESARSFDRHLLIRGTILLALDPLAMSFAFGAQGIVFQVLYAIGLAMLMLVPLRRLPSWMLFAGALLALAGLEVLVDAARPRASAFGEVCCGLVFDLGFIRGSGPLTTVFLLYPALPWLAMCCFGFVCGRWLARAPVRPGRRLALAGLMSLALFVGVRALDGYGNVGLGLEDASLRAWLHVSKYPPSLCFAALELGLCCLCLAACFGLRARLRRPVSEWNPLLVFGRTPFFFYLLHIPILATAAFSLGRFQGGDLRWSWGAVLGACLVLYPLCRLYGRYKAARPGGWTRYL